MSGNPADGDKRPERTEPREDSRRSGEGADTALEALIRQRKMAEGPDTTDPVPPSPSAP